MNRRFFIISASQLATTLLPTISAAAETESIRPPREEPFPINYSDLQKIKPRFRRKEVEYPTNEVPGSIVVDPAAKYLYFILDGGTALRYGIGVGREGFE